jgi:hypothetical protein
MVTMLNTIKTTFVSVHLKGSVPYKTSHTPLLRAPPTTASALRSHSDPNVYNSETLPGYSIN